MEVSLNLKERLALENIKKYYWNNYTAIAIDECELLEKLVKLFTILDVSGGCLEKADFWYCTHKNHVNKLYRTADKGYPPTDILDVNNPELWKAEHWKWYLDNYR